MTFQTADGVPVFPNGTNNDGLTAFGEPVFGLGGDVPPELINQPPLNVLLRM